MRSLLSLCGVLIGMMAVSAAEPESVWLEDTPQPLPIEAPHRDEVLSAMRRGQQFLLDTQNDNGSWGSATSTKELNIYAPIPGAHHAFRAAVTSLAISALQRTPTPPDFEKETREAVALAEQWLLSELPKVRRANRDAIYNVWAHAFSIEAMCDLIDLHEAEGKPTDELRAAINEQITMLQKYEAVDSGWGYYDFRAHTQRPNASPTSFTTATILIALKKAEEHGIEVPRRLVDRGMTILRRMQKPDFTYYYSYGGATKDQPMRSINRPGGSLGRSQACNLALHEWGDPAITQRVLEVWLDRLFARNLWLDMGRKRPIPHESHFLVAGYFFYYGHWYGARCIPELPADMQQPHKDQMARLMVDLQERDGSWWDYPFYAYHQEYGTAMALMTLAHCL
ncbi:MAG: hypothetical protein AAGF97_19345 [Planctomycetota bacterium]